MRLNPLRWLFGVLTWTGHMVAVAVVLLICLPFAAWLCFRYPDEDEAKEMDWLEGEGEL